MTKSFPFEMPFEKYNDTTDRNLTGRLESVFQTADQDVIKLMSLLGKAKEKDLRKDMFGRAEFAV